MTAHIGPANDKGNRSMPPGVIIPELAYSDVRKAAEWLCRAFGFSEHLRIADHRVQLSFGGNSMVVTERPARRSTGSSAGDPRLSPEESGTHSIMMRVPDADRHHEHVKKQGARILRPPTDYPFGERQYTAEDLEGHRWTFSQTIADVDPKTWGGVLGEAP